MRPEEENSPNKHFVIKKYKQMKANFSAIGNEVGKIIKYEIREFFRV
jgi:hypothetical protein